MERETVYLGVTIYSGLEDDESFYAHDKDDSCYCKRSTEKEAIEQVKEHLDRWGLPEDKYEIRRYQ